VPGSNPEKLKKAFRQVWSAAHRDDDEGIANRAANVRSVSDVFAVDDEWSPQFKEAKNAFAPEVRLVALLAEMASGNPTQRGGPG
jgi:predicted metalloprotease